MSSLSDDLAGEVILTGLLGIPIMFMIVILAIPLVIVSCITGVPVITLAQNLFVFGIAVFVVWLFSRYQIIENGIMGLLAGVLVNKCLKWHPVVCIIIGAIVVAAFFAVCFVKIGFWIKTVIFSLIITLIVYAIVYSDYGLFPASDTVWRITFFIVFLLENIVIRFSLSGFDIGIPQRRKTEKTEQQHEGDHDADFSSADQETVHDEVHEETQNASAWFAGIRNDDDLKKRYRDLMKIYHPDNQAGDTKVVQQIQMEYDMLLKNKYQN